MTALIRSLRAQWSRRPSRRSLLRSALSVAVVLGGAWLIVMPELGGEGDAAAVGVPRVGRPAPEFTVQTLTATPFTLSAARGRPVWVNFWASWCPPCRAEIPDIEAARAQAGDRLEFIAVNMDEPRPVIESFMSKAGYRFPVGVDPEGEISRLYAVRGLPMHFFIAADGTVASVRVGGMTRGDMFETVSALISGEPLPSPGREFASTADGGSRVGAALYNAQCLRCHGGPDGAGVVAPAPPHTNDGHTWHHSDTQLMTVIMRGSGDRQAMPAFQDRLSPEEARNILAYIKTWWGEEQRTSQAQATRERDRARN